jgi:hypothetical protein
VTLVSPFHWCTMGLWYGFFVVIDHFLLSEAFALNSATVGHDVTVAIIILIT